MELCFYGNPILKTPASPIQGEPDQALIDEMIKALYKFDGIGLAAPQIGVSQQIFVYDFRGGKDPQVIINPKLSRHMGREIHQEGCLSIPGIDFQIPRSYRVRLDGFDREMNPIRIDALGLRARLFQHEVDHLQGLVLINRLSQRNKEKFEKELLGKLNGIC